MSKVNLFEFERKRKQRAMDMTSNIQVIKSNPFYRMGDIVFHKGWPPNYNEWKFAQQNVVERDEFNGSILKEYISQVPSEFKTDTKKRLSDEEIGEKFTNIINKKIIENEYIIPDDDELVIHLRVGDTSHHDWFLKKPYFKLIKLMTNKYKINKISFVACFHFADVITDMKDHFFRFNNHVLSRNKHMLNNFFYSIIKNFPDIEMKVISREDVDSDFVYMCKSKHFISDEGGFSKLISIIRNNDPTIQTKN